MPRARMTQRSNLFKKLPVSRQLIWVIPVLNTHKLPCSIPGGIISFHFYFLEEKFYVQGPMSHLSFHNLFLSGRLVGNSIYLNTGTSMGHPMNSKVKLMNKIFLRCIFDRNISFFQFDLRK